MNDMPPSAMIASSPLRSDQPFEDVRDTPKTSGTVNLSRAGWDEDQCRNFLVRVLDWVPRNFNYEDGLRVIHPQLQERFGDENVDLACGVLDELIEVDNYNPFPGSSYQRWKHTHRHRRENLQLPHVPHTTTIMAQVVPTRTLLEWRAQNAAPTTTRLPPASSTFKTGISTITHRSAWRIEHTLFVSTGGGRATVHHCPSPEEFHSRLWDPDYGRGGNLVEAKSHSQPQSLIRIGFTAEAPAGSGANAISAGSTTSNSTALAVSNRAWERKQARALQLEVVRNVNNKDRSDHTIMPAIGFSDTAYEELGSNRNLPKPGTKPALGSGSPIRNVPLPHGTKIPNAIFARKHQLVPEGIPLPEYFFKGLIQPTAAQLGVAKAEHIFELAQSAVVKSHKKATELNENETKECEESIMKEYFSYFKGPFTADLFYDGGLDFKWHLLPNDESPQVPDYTSPTRGKKRGFFSRSPANKSLTNASARGVLTSKASKDSLAAERRGNRRKQITTVGGNPQLIHPQQDKHAFRDSRFFRAFHRKSVAASPKMEPVPPYRSDISRAGFADQENVGVPGIPIVRRDTDILRFSDQKFKFTGPGRRGEEGSITKSASITLPLPAVTANMNRTSLSLPQTPNKQVLSRRTCRKVPSNLSLSTTLSGSDFPKTPTHPPHSISRAGLSLRPALLEVSGNITAATIHETLAPKAFDNTALPVYNFASRRTDKNLNPELKLVSFDGAADEIHFSSSDQSAINKARRNNVPSRTHNTNKNPRNENQSISRHVRNSMDSNRDLLHRSAQPPPLQIRKQSVKHLRAATKQRIRNNSNPEKSYREESLFPPRTSSIPRAELPEDPKPAFQTRGKDTVVIAQSNTRSRKIVPDNSSDIMGDFVALNGLAGREMQDKTDGDITLLNVAAKHHYPKPTHNPYEFERSPLLDRLDDEGHLASFRNFMKGQEVKTERASSPRASHMKNSRSEGNAAWVTRKPTPMMNTATKPMVNTFHRRESTSNVSSGRGPSRDDISPSADYLSHYYAEDEMSCSPAPHGRQVRDDAVRREHRVAEHRSTSASSHKLYDDYARRSRSRSPARRAGQQNLRESFSSSSTYGHMSSSTDAHSSSSTNNHYQIKSPTKALADVVESDELDGKTPRPKVRTYAQTSLPKRPSGRNVDESDEFDGRLSRPEARTNTETSPPKRSRSPMKKMFGENGWLTHSPIVKQGEQYEPKKPTIPKKPTMMGRIKHKFGEIAEKADMSPRHRSDRERRPKQSVLTRSITPFEQARIYTELELMVVYTANVFLMNQFSEARIAIDTIRKTIDSWKSKGRPMVTEFMYDQSTQRNLVALNQHNFRFHGPGAGDEIRISSMLYNWKQVANIMATRTFCDADPVILKLLFDIEHILEVLGAGEPFMLRLQEISKGVKDTIVLARHKKDLEETKTHSRGQQAAPGAEFRSETPHRGRSESSPYGGMKLPDSYHG